MYVAARHCWNTSLEAGFGLGSGALVLLEKKMKLAICLFLLFTARLFYLLFTLKIMRSFLGPVSESI